MTMTIKRLSVTNLKIEKQCLLRGTAVPAGPITHYHKRTHFRTYARCSENHNNERGIASPSDRVFN